MAYGSGGGRWSMWTKQHAAVALRQVVVLAGVRANEYARHSLALGAQRTYQQGVPPQGRCNGRAGVHLMPRRRTFVATGRMPAG